jgi:hypothetical protein
MGCLEGSGLFEIVPRQTVVPTRMSVECDRYDATDAGDDRTLV